jgi:hypothetical protein
MKKESFIAELKTLIDAKFAEITARKPEGKTVNFFDFLTISLAARNVFKNKLSVIPKQVEVACLLAEALMAPTTAERCNRVKAAVAISGGAAGLAMVIAGIGLALGWGVGVVSTICAWFVGTSMLGPIAWIAGGVAVAGIAGYFAFSGDDASRAERAINALKKGIEGAIEAIWPELGGELGA